MMFHLETEFQETPIGKIPKAWGTTQLSELSEHITKGTTPTTYGFGYTASGINFIKVESIDERGAFIPENIPHISEEAYESFSRSILRENDILFSIAGALGRVATVTNEILPANINQALAIIRLKEKDKLSAEYLKYFLMGSQIQNFVRTITIQSQQANINLEHVRNFTIALPPLGEKRAIIGILGVVDSAVELLDKVIAKTERLKKGLMQRLLTQGIGHSNFKNSRELGCNIPENWEVARLDDVAYIKGRIGWRGLKSSEYTKTGPYMIALEHISHQKIDWAICDHISMFRYEESPEIQLRTNDVIMSKDGVHAGEVSFVDYLPDMATINSTMMLVRATSKSLTPKFLLYFLQSTHFRRFVRQKTTGSAIPHIFQRDMKNLFICLPPLEEQSTISRVLDVVNNRYELEMKQKANLERTKLGLMDLLLTGKVRVKAD